MAELSPAAQAVLTAQAKERCLFEWSAVNDPPCHPSDADWNGCIQCIDRRGLAAALRAAADQVEQKLRGFSRETCQEIRSIAAELDGIKPTSEGDYE